MEPRQFAQVSDLGVQRAPTPTPSAGPQGGPAVKHAKGEGRQGAQRLTRRPAPHLWTQCLPTSLTRLSRSARVRLTATTCAPAARNASTVLRPMPEASED